MKKSKLSEQIRKLRSDMAKAEKNLEAAKAESDTSRDPNEPEEVGLKRAADQNAKISYLENRVAMFRHEIDTANERLLKQAVKGYNPIIEQDLELDIIAEAGRSLAILIHVLGAIKAGSAVSELRFLQCLPEAIKKEADKRDSEGAAVVEAYEREVKQSNILKELSENPGSFQRWKLRLYNQVAKNDFEFLESLER